MDPRVRRAASQRNEWCFELHSAVSCPDPGEIADLLSTSPKQGGGTYIVEDGRHLTTTSDVWSILCVLCLNLAYAGLSQMGAHHSFGARALVVRFTSGCGLLARRLFHRNRGHARSTDRRRSLVWYGASTVPVVPPERRVYGRTPRRLMHIGGASRGGLPKEKGRFE